MKLLKYSTMLAVLSAATCGLLPEATMAANLLPNGGLESGSGPANWALSQSITGMPGARSVRRNWSTWRISAFCQSQVSVVWAYFLSRNRATRARIRIRTKPSMYRSRRRLQFRRVRTSLSLGIRITKSRHPIILIPCLRIRRRERSSPTATAYTVDFLDSGGNMIAGASQTVNPIKNRATDVNPDDWITSTIPSLNSPANAASAG